MKFIIVQLVSQIFITVRNSSCGKVMFSQASVILSTGGVHGKGVACMAEGCAWQERRPLQRTVRILLECILVINLSLQAIYIWSEIRKHDAYSTLHMIHNNLVI